MPTVGERLKHAWDAFTSRDPTNQHYNNIGASYSYRPDRLRFHHGVERTFVTSIYNQLATDVADVRIEHVVKDDMGRYLYTVDSGLNKIFNLEANVDQASTAFIRDIVMSMFDEGCVAVVPIETSISPMSDNPFEIHKMRTAKIVGWYPEHIRVNIYNEKQGSRQEMIFPKSSVAIIENPFYSIMNEPNSVLQRLMRKIVLLDRLDEDTNSGKLDMIIQLPYAIKTEARREQAEKRRKDIEFQLSGSKYGIAYTDGTEKITQLNRSLESNLWKEVQELTSMLYNQLGLTETIFNGTANEEAMIHYYNRTIKPILTAICEELERKFLSKNARTRGHAIMYFRDMFGLVSSEKLAELGDKFIRNEILTKNEFRQQLGLSPDTDPRSDMLLNPNLNHQDSIYEGAGLEGMEGMEGMEEMEEGPVETEA